MTLEQRIIALAQAIGVDIKAQASQRIEYATGLWTPSVQNATGYQSRAGRYTRIGQQVFLEGEFQLDSTKTGGFLIEGLPYPAHPEAPAGGIHVHQYQTARAFAAVTGEIIPGTSTFQVLAATGPSTSLSTYANTFGKTGALSFSGHYTIA
jgi:hypothetical protein